jgi:hypothetical protein
MGEDLRQYGKLLAAAGGHPIGLAGHTERNRQ